MGVVIYFNRMSESDDFSVLDVTDPNSDDYLHVLLVH